MREMKNSGVEWIGEIPATWTVSKLKNYIKCYDGRRVPIDSAKRVSGPYPYWGAGSITDYVDDYLFDEELILLGEDGAPFFDDTRPVAFLINEKIWANNHIHVIKPLPLINASFLVNYLNIVDYGTYINGSILSKLTQSNMNNISLVVPSLEEQHRIADFLDEKCAKIDAVIEKQKQVIEKLKEYKLSVITEAVTKGLDPTVPMKDSGVEWIGEIPKDWEIKKLKYATTIMRGRFNHRPRNDPDYYDGQYPFVQTGDVARANKYISNYSQTLNDLGYSVSKEFPSGSIVMTIAANVADVAILNFHACFPDSVVGFVPKNIEPMYLFYVLKSMKKQLLRNAIISTQLNLNIEIIKEEFIPIPPKDEQNIILNALEKKIAEIDSSIVKKEAIVDKLTEYKKSLIYEVVTGKREV